jgi:hypothetical protein
MDRPVERLVRQVSTDPQVRARAAAEIAARAVADSTGASGSVAAVAGVE